MSSAEGARQIFWSEDVKRLEWIQSQVEGSYKTDGTNSSWIELPYTTLPGDRIEVNWTFISLPPNDSTYGIIWGGGDKKYGNWRTLACGVSGSGASIYNGTIGMGSVTSSGSLPGPITTTLNATQQQDPFNMTMFIQNEVSLGNGYTHQFFCKCFWCKITRSNSLIFDLIPATVKNEAGLLNLVDNVFYTSESQVPFIAGPTLRGGDIL